MAGRRKQPVDLILMNGNKADLSKAEIEERRKQEAGIKGYTDNVGPPNYLTAKQKKEFIKTANELLRLNIFENLDVDTLAMYIVARQDWQDMDRAMRKLKPIIERMDAGTGESYNAVDTNYSRLARLKIEQMGIIRRIANEMGLSISSRLKLIVPTAEEKPANKFTARKQS